MMKIGQNWSKIANHPPNAQHKSAPLPAGLYYLQVPHFLLQNLISIKKFNKIQFQCFPVQNLISVKKIQFLGE